MYVALSPNYGLCKSAQKNNINNFVQIAHSDCLITTIILQVSIYHTSLEKNTGI